MHSNWLSAVVVLGLASGFSAGAARAAEMTSGELSLVELSEMEQLLAQLNFDPGAVDGEVDDRTRTAIRLYQEFAILPVDGEPSPKLLSELRQVSQVYAEMRAAPPEPEPEPESQVVAEPESVPVAKPDVAVAEPAPESAPEAPEPPAETKPVAEAPAPEPTVAASVDLKPEAEPVAAEPVADTAEPVEPVEPEPVAPELPAAASSETEPAPEPEVAEQVEPEIAVAESVEPEPEPEPAEPEPTVAEPAPGPKPEPKPKPSEAQVAEAVADAPESEQEATKPADPLPEVAPEVAEPPAEPKAAEPEAVARFSITSMIARLKERDHAEKKASSTQVAPAAATDQAGRERTLIWKTQQELRRIGLDPGAADGNLRTRTTSAIATYQRARGLSADGRVSAGLLAQLEAEAPPATSQPGSEGAVFASVSPQTAAIGVTPGNGYQAFQAGYSAAQAGDFGAAVKLYDQAIDGGDLALEHLAAALYNRANAYQYLGVMEKAIEDYSAAIANKPSFPAAYYNRGFALDTKGEQGRAVKDFRKARDLGLQRLGVRSPDLPPPLL